MDVKYTVVDLGDNYSKFTVNDDCTIVSDSKNINKLCDYLDLINNYMSDNILLDKKEVKNLKQAQNLLNKFFKEEQSVTRKVKPVKGYAKTKDSLLNNLLNERITYGNDPLARLIPDEVIALIMKSGTCEQKDSIPISYKKHSTWFTSVFGTTHKRKHHSYVVSFLNAKTMHVDYKSLSTSFGKAKYAIDSAGGIRTLFRYVKEKRQLKNGV